jgi:hypothetical protein
MNNRALTMKNHPIIFTNLYASWPNFEWRTRFPWKIPILSFISGDAVLSKEGGIIPPACLKMGTTPVSRHSLA